MNAVCEALIYLKMELLMTNSDLYNKYNTDLTSKAFYSLCSYVEFM